MCKNLINLLKLKGQTCVDHISCLRRLTELNIFQNFSTISRTSGFATSEQCQLLLRLKELVHLKRGDFLCEVLEYVNDRPNLHNTKLKLKGFWPSEDYFFHNDYQMKLVNKYCPQISKACFMYKQECCGSLSVLENFRCLAGKYQ